MGKADRSELPCRSVVRARPGVVRTRSFEPRVNMVHESDGFVAYGLSHQIKAVRSTVSDAGMDASTGRPAIHSRGKIPDRRSLRSGRWTRPVARFGGGRSRGRHGEFGLESRIEVVPTLRARTPAWNSQGTLESAVVEGRGERRGYTGHVSTAAPGWVAVVAANHMELPAREQPVLAAIGAAPTQTSASRGFPGSSPAQAIGRRGTIGVRRPARAEVEGGPDAPATRTGSESQVL